MVCMKETGYYNESLYIFASTSTFRLHSAIKNHCQIIFYANRSSAVSYFMNFWTEKICSELNPPMFSISFHHIIPILKKNMRPT